jgi:protein required for attachment to host cells
MKRKNTWILVADSTRARLLQKTEPSGYQDIGGVDFIGDSRRSIEINSDRPGRSFDSHGSGRHAMEPSTDPQELEKRRFAERLGAHLDDQCALKAFDQLVVIASPHMLGDLRDVFSDQVKERVVEEIDKDITKLSPVEMNSALERLIQVVH